MSNGGGTTSPIGENQLNVPNHPFVPATAPSYDAGPGAGALCQVCGEPENDPVHQVEGAAAKPITMADGSYPISDQHSANSAWKLRGRSKTYSEVQVVAHIRKACSALGLSFPGKTSKEVQVAAHRLVSDMSFVERLRARYDRAVLSAAGPQTDDGEPDGLMVAFYPPAWVAQRFALAGGEPAEDMHVTLAFLGTKPEDQDTLDRLKDIVAGFAATSGPVIGEISGLGLFTGGETPVTYASIDCPALPEFRQRLVDTLDTTGFPPSKSHGYTPHMTLAYGDERNIDIPATPVEFTEVWLVAGTERFAFALPGPAERDQETAKITQQPHPGFAAETEIIRKNKKHPNAKKRHPFTPSMHKTADGSRRCLQCGGPQPAGGTCTPPDLDGNQTVGPPGAQIVPIQSKLEDNTEAGKVAAGIDAGVDQALVLLRSTADLPPYAEQARDVLQGIEPACDSLLEYFGVDDPDDDDSDQTAAEQSYDTTTTVPYIGGFTITPPMMTTTTTNIPPATTNLPIQFAYTQPRLRKPELPYLAKAEPPNSFVTELNGKTLITTQASVMKQLADAVTPHEHMLWTAGRLVGADQPNRNGAFWSSSDLQSGKATVPHGPLNWLHEERHVIGTLAAAQYVPVDPGNEKADGTDTGLNHIAVAAPVWRWLYPDEADVLEMASDAGKFWYSMECISNTVACIGPEGCGVEVGYFDYMNGVNGTCEHMTQRSGTRQFKDPIFLGAAVIVPPVRPGWTDADASVLRQASSLAEKAFEDVGRPDMSVSEWEQLMCQVVAFATG